MEELNKRDLKNMWTTYGGLDGDELGSGKQTKQGVFKNFMTLFLIQILKWQQRKSHQTESKACGLTTMSLHKNCH